MVEDGAVLGVLVTVAVLVTFAASGEVPFAVAVMTRVPPSISACVTVWLAVQVVIAAGASVETGQETESPSEAVTPTVLSVRLPVLVTTRLYETLSPALDGVPVAVPEIEIAGAGATVVVRVTESARATASGDWAAAFKVRITLPAVTSAWVTVYAGMVQLVDAPGAREALVQVMASLRESVRAMLDTVWSPLLVKVTV